MAQVTAEAPSLTKDYTKELQDALPEDSSSPAVQSLLNSIDQLASDMESFERAEETAGASADVWDTYGMQHQETIDKTKRAADADKKNAADASDCVQAAKDQLLKNASFFREQCAELLRQQEEHQKEISALHEEVQELRRLAEQTSPEAVGKCIAAATIFLNEVLVTRDAAREQPRLVAGELFANTRKSVHDTYQSIRFAPSRIKHYLQNKKNDAVDNVINHVAGILEQGAQSLSKHRDAVLKSSPLTLEHEERKAAAKYLTVIDEEIQANGGKRNFLCEKHAAAALAKAGIRESIIEKTLAIHSTEPKMKTGLAKELASEAVNEEKNVASEKTEAAR